jgi:Flp pilus assembly protein TadG
VILVTLAIAGAIAGVAGFAIALAAHNRVSQVVQECADVLRRQLQVANGTADSQAMRDMAIVHYDALKEMSGQLSFSMALVNAEGDGVVITSINGRSETRTYAKVVRAGNGEQTLSPEEQQALRAARLGKGPAVSMDDPLPDTRLVIDASSDPAPA